MPIINYALISKDSVILADALAFKDEKEKFDWTSKGCVTNDQGCVNTGMKPHATTSVLKHLKLKFGKNHEDDNNDNSAINEHVYILLAKQVLEILDTTRNLQFFCAENIHEK